VEFESKWEKIWDKPSDNRVFNVFNPPGKKKYLTYPPITQCLMCLICRMTHRLLSFSGENL
jgi:hypothetical protein